MLRFLRDLFVAPPPRSYPGASPNLVLYAVGDIHGRADLLECVIDAIDEDRSRLDESVRALDIYLGDYVDRGSDSRGVIERLAARAAEVEAVFLRGNHEEALLSFLAGREPVEDWASIGGLPTLLSYGLEPASLGRGRLDDEVGAAFASKLPAHHLKFLTSTNSYCEFGDYLFVHAGLRPGIPLEQQSTRDLLWIRQEFLSGNVDIGKIVVHGHTPTPAPDFQRFRINIDTGAYATNVLTCLKIDSDGPRVLFATGREARGAVGTEATFDLVPVADRT